MVTRRIVACLDVDRGRVVKGVRFTGLRDAGDPAGRAADYQEQGADEIVILDVSATREGRPHALEVVRRIRGAIALPLTVGGGVRRVEDALALLDAGADKVAVNTAAVRDPGLIGALAARFGVQCVTVAIDAARAEHVRRAAGRLVFGWDAGSGTGTGTGSGGPRWEVVVAGGRDRTGLDVVGWAAEAERQGAGEILLTSWDRDGTGAGYDRALIAAVRSATSTPLVASGGGRTAADLAEALEAGADAVLVASSLHDGHTTVGALKAELLARGLEVRP